MSAPSTNNFNFDFQAIAVPGSKKPGQSAVYRNAISPDKLYDKPCPEVSTLFESFQNALKVSRSKRCLGHRPYNKQTKRFEDYVWQTYEEVLQRFTNFGSGLLYLNEHVVKNDELEKISIGIWSINRPEFNIVEQANSAYNFISVPLYATLGPMAVEYILNHAEIKIAVVSANHITNLIELSSKTPLKVIISMDPLEDIQSLTSKKDIHLYTFDQVEKIGREHPRDFNPPKPEDISTISYTSGTTGLPKGVMLTHRNFTSMLSGLSFTLQGRTDDIIISYLPMAHIFGRACEAQAIFHASAIGYYHGDINKLIEDVQLLKPTIFPSVPRIFNKIYNMLMETYVNAGEMTRKAIEEKFRLFERTGEVTHPAWDAMFSEYRKILGGHVRVLQSAAAPIGPEIKSFLAVVFSSPFIEAYGSTEGTGLATNSIIGDPRASHVGPPFVCSEIKLTDVPEMEYTSEDKPYPRGEIYVRGPNIMRGYHKDPEKTMEAIDKDGWMRSGDIGMIDSRGCLVVIDRIKNIFKLSQGEYISPEKIEIIYQRSPLVSQMYVHGDTLRSALVGIVVPHTDALLPWAEKLLCKKLPTNGDTAKELELLKNNQKVRLGLLKEINDFGRKQGLKGFELVKAIYIELIPFSVENDILTPTFKLKRPAALKRYKNIIEQLYVECQASLNIESKI